MPSDPPHNLSTTPPVRSSCRLRDDLVIAEVDHDLVVFDPVRLESHVLSGGAVTVWHELQWHGVSGLIDRAAGQHGVRTDDIADDVTKIIEQFAALGLLSADLDH